MLIVDKYKDYYDHLSHVYGVDKKVVFDRRGSMPIDNKYIIDSLFPHRRYWYGRDTLFFVLEVGRVQYLFRVFNFKISKDAYGTLVADSSKAKIEIEHVFKEGKNFFGQPLSLKGVRVSEKWNKKKRKYEIVITDFKNTVETYWSTFDEVKYPILSDTTITSLISAFDIWIELSNYISSLKNDREADIVNSDKAKIVNHGFDVKTSFRHPVK